MLILQPKPASMNKLLFFFLMAVFVVSCNKSYTDDEIRSQIVGEWEGEYYAGENVVLENGKKGFFGNKKIGLGIQTINFNENNTYSIIRHDQKYVVDKNYFVENGDVYFEHENAYYTVVKINSKKMILQDIDGRKFTYKKK